MSTLHFAAVALLFHVLLPLYVDAVTSALTFELGDNEEACFYHQFSGSELQTFTYEVIRGGQNDIDAAIQSPNGKILYRETKKTRDTFRFYSSFGTFSFCFGNEFSTFSHKVIYFSVRPTSDAADDDAADLAVGRGRPHASTQSESSVDAMHEDLVKILRHQTSYRLNEMRGRAIAENMQARVQWWSLGQACVIVVAGCAQILVLKCLFTETRSKTGAL